MELSHAPAARGSLINPDDEIFEKLEAEAESDYPEFNFEDDFDAQPPETEEVKLKRKTDKARAICPIRTRYKPAFEEEERRRHAEKRQREAEKHGTGMKRASCASLGTHVSVNSSQTALTVYSPVSDHSKRSPRAHGAAARPESWNDVAAILERRESRASLRSRQSVRSGRTDVPGRHRLEKYGKLRASVHRASQQMTNIGDVIVDLAHEDKHDFVGAGAEQNFVHMLSGMIGHVNANDMKSLGVTDAESKRMERHKSMAQLEEEMGMTPGPTAFEEMKQHGRFYSSARSMTKTSLEEERKLQEELTKPRFVQVREEGLTREDAMAMMNEGLVLDDDKKGESAFHKVAVSLQTVEDVWWANCKGQAAIRRKAEPHEAVYDFADCRIAMPRYLKEGRAGQLIIVKPDIDEQGNKGEVLVYTKAPKRRHNKIESKLEELGDVITKEKGTDHSGALTTLTAPARKGEWRIVVASTAPFKLGQAVIIDGGTATEEANEIDGFGSIILKQPLQFDHGPGVTVFAKAGSHGLQRHGHVAVQKKPTSSKAWLEWRDQQRSKRQAAYDAALAQGMATRKSVAAELTAKFGDDEWESQESDASEGAKAAMSEHIASARTQTHHSQSVSARNNSGRNNSGRLSALNSGRNSGRNESARLSSRGSPRDMISGRGLQGPSPRTAMRRAGMDASEQLADDTRWDFRPPPTPEEMDRLLHKVADRLAAAGHLHHDPLSHVARQHTHHHDHHASGEDAQAAAESFDPFEDDGVECIWVLREVEVEETKDRLDLLFAVPLDDDFEQPEEELDENEAAVTEEEFWQDIFQPIPKTWVEKLKDMMGIG